VNRPETALAALLFSVAIVAPAAAQQAPLTPQSAVREFCSGCFAYLEFPPLTEDGATSSLASAPQDTLSPTTAGQVSPIGAPEPSVVASVRQ
jgi:hypothetical protein